MATRLDGIANYLQGIRPQTSPLDSMMLQRSLKNPPPIIKSGETYPNAGLYGGPATLPSYPGPTGSLFGDTVGVDIPPIGPSSVPPGPVVAFGPGNYPVSGVPSSGSGPDVQVNWTGQGSVPHWNQPPTTSTASGGITFGPGGQLQGGNRGSQGSVYGTDPNTGQPIYNVTGSPRPGFFDSKTGKFVETLGSTALNMWIPGLGFVTKAIFDAYRRNQAKNNTGTDLSGNNPAATSNPAPSPAPTVPQSGALFGYNPNSGGGGGTPRYNYGGGYSITPSTNPLYNPGSGWQPVANAPTDIRFSQNSGTGNWIADQTTKNWEAGGGYGGAPNNMGNTGDEGHTIFYPWSQGAQTHGQIIDGTLTSVRNTPEWLAAHPRPYSSPAMDQNAHAQLDQLAQLLKANPDLYARAMNPALRNSNYAPPLQITPARG